jgi:hypothetical protein
MAVHLFFQFFPGFVSGDFVVPVLAAPVALFPDFSGLDLSS